MINCGASLVQSVGWLGAGFPPGRSDLGEFLLVLEAMHLANHEAALVLRSTGAPTATIHNLSWMLALVALTAFSVPGALWAGGAFDALIDLGKSVGMAIVVIAAVRGKRDVARLAGVYFAGAVIYAFIIVTRFRVGGGSRPLTTGQNQRVVTG